MIVRLYDFFKTIILLLGVLKSLFILFTFGLSNANKTKFKLLNQQIIIAAHKIEIEITTFLKIINQNQILQ